MNAAQSNEPRSSLTSSGSDKKSRKRKTLLIDDALHKLDVLILIQISTLYFLDNSTWLLLLRFLCQTLFVSPRLGDPELIPQCLPPLFANILCLVTHLSQARPEAENQEARDYLHGGLLLDFVGQQGPISKWNLFLMDILLLTLQMLSQCITYQKFKEFVPLDKPKAVAAIQDLESEEAGVLTSGEVEAVQIESRGEDVLEAGVGDMTRLGGVNTDLQEKDQYALDQLWSGNSTLFHLDIAECLKELWMLAIRGGINAPEPVPPAGLVGTLLSRLAEGRPQAASN